ncbi:MAG: hypothetical protein CMC52_01975 [Flavobacteriaceae bacterium]|jgi:hypothetical protein|nr:hypothetical protein [Flavobacteriaceae bacterium]|tara:strand:- start:320 stop:535 length:216 start_codon:yes stop_codon:yes gene_type:complete
MIENINKIIKSIDITLFIIYGFMGFGSVYLGSLIRDNIDLPFWPELLICVIIISPMYFLVRLAKKKYLPKS